MDDKNPLTTTLRPRTRATTNSSRLPGTIEVSGSQGSNDDLPNQRGSDKQEKDSKNPRNSVAGKDYSGTRGSDQAHSSAKESELISSSSSPKVEDAANAFVAFGDEQDSSKEIEESEEIFIIDRLRVGNDHLIMENEQLRRLIEAIKIKQKQES